MLAFVIHRKVERLFLQSHPDANPYRNVRCCYYILLYEKIKGDCLVKDTALTQNNPIDILAGGFNTKATH